MATLSRLAAKLCVGGGGTMPCVSMRFDGNAIEPKYMPCSSPLKFLLCGCGDVVLLLVPCDVVGGARSTKCTTFPLTSKKEYYIHIKINIAN